LCAALSANLVTILDRVTKAVVYVVDRTLTIQENRDHILELGLLALGNDAGVHCHFVIAEIRVNSQSVGLMIVTINIVTHLIFELICSYVVRKLTLIEESFSIVANPRYDGLKCVLSK
jgi:hypothetical protein